MLACQEELFESLLTTLGLVFLLTCPQKARPIPTITSKHTKIISWQAIPEAPITDLLLV
jgi:hypothetical protein